MQPSKHQRVKKHHTQVSRDLPEEDFEARNRMDFYDNSYTDQDYGSNAPGQMPPSASPDLPVHDINDRHAGHRGPSRSDERVCEEICEMLTRHSSLDASRIHVQVRHGEVSLWGWVPERRMRLLAEHVADHCHGVRDIHNRLKVDRQLNAHQVH